MVKSKKKLEGGKMSGFVRRNWYEFAFLTSPLRFAGSRKSWKKMKRISLSLSLSLARDNDSKVFTSGRVATISLERWWGKTGWAKGLKQINNISTGIQVQVIIDLIVVKYYGRKPPSSMSKIKWQNQLLSSLVSSIHWFLSLSVHDLGISHPPWYWECSSTSALDWWWDA